MQVRLIGKKVGLELGFCDTPRDGDVGAHVVTGILSATTTISHARSAHPCLIGTSIGDTQVA